MKLWSVQTQEMYQQLRKQGTLLASPQKADFFPEAYRWMAAQMDQRLPTKPVGAQVPFWAWYMWEGERRPPDVLNESGHETLGAQLVLLALDVPDELVLLSDFDTWHYVLNCWYLPTGEKEDHLFEKEYEAAGETFHTVYDSPFRNRIIQSWQRIFTLEPNEYTTTADSIQATFWQMKMEWVQEAALFTAK